MQNIKTKNIFPSFSIETNQVFSYVNNLQELNDFTKILLDSECDMEDLNNNVNCDIKVDTTNVVNSINDNKDSKIVESKLNKVWKYLGFGFETKIENSFNGNVGCDINIKW